MSARPRTAIGERLDGRFRASRRGGHLALLVLRELRGALRDERVPLTDERAARVLAHRHDDLPALAERVGHAALVADRHRRAARALAHPELVHVAAPDVRPL